MDLFFRELGEGAPIVILHGVFGSSDNWLSISKALAVKYKIFLVDLRNHGQSFHSDVFNLKVMADDLDQFLKHHHIIDPIIIGHSMGGKVIMKFASLYSNYRKLIVVDIAPRYYRKHHDEILKGLNSLDFNKIQTRNEADKELQPFVPEIGVRQFLLKNLYRKNDHTFGWRINLKVLTEKIENIGEAIEDNVRIEKPTLFIKGAESKYIQEKDMPLINTIFGNYNLVTIEGAGHWVQAEKPEEFTNAVLNFIN